MAKIRLPRPRRIPRPEQKAPSRRALLQGGAATSMLAACSAGKNDTGLLSSFAEDTAQPDTGDADTGAADTGRLDTGDPIDTGPPTEIFDVEAVPEDIDRFPTAIQAGAMKQASVVLAVFVADAAVVRVRVWQPLDDGSGEVALYHDALHEPDRDGYLKLTVADLEAGEWYAWCALTEDSSGAFDTRSMAAQFRTALPEDSREPVTVAISSCNGPTNDPWPSLMRTAEHDYDVFIHLGDMAYNDTCSTLSDFRESWRWYLSGDGFRHVYAKAGMYATWDDHEIENDWTIEDVDETLFANGQQSMFEVLALEEDKGRRLWRRYRWGETVEFFVLDCRGEREPSKGHYISPEQLQWLLDGLSDSTCHFKVIVNSVPITNMPDVWDLADGDRWEGFPSQRYALLDHIKDNGIDNVWFLAGDFHVCFTAQVEDDYPMWEIAVSGGNVNPLGVYLSWLYPDQFPYAIAGGRGVLLTFDPDADTVHVRFLSDDGSVDHEATLTASTTS